MKPILLLVAVLALAACEKTYEQPNPTPGAIAAAGKPAEAAPATGAPAAAPAAPAVPAAPEKGPAADAVVTDAARAEAENLFATNCANCHGTTGNGDGPVAAGFPVKPRAFADGTWQKSVSDGHIETVVMNGGPSVGKSPLMPGNPTLKDNLPVLAALREKVRGYGPKAQ